MSANRVTLRVTAIAPVLIYVITPRLNDGPFKVLIVSCRVRFVGSILFHFTPIYTGKYWKIVIAPLFLALAMRETSSRSTRQWEYYGPKAISTQRCLARCPTHPMRIIRIWCFLKLTDPSLNHSRHGSYIGVKYHLTLFNTGAIRPIATTPDSRNKKFPRIWTNCQLFELPYFK